MPRSQRETKRTPVRPGRKTPQAKQTREAPEKQVAEATTETATNQTATRAKATHHAAPAEVTQQTASPQAGAKSENTKSENTKSESNEAGTKTATQETVAGKEAANKEAKGSRSHKAPAGKSDPRAEFLAGQKAALVAERMTYLKQADELKAQADSLALEHEPGDVQFDEEGGEGGTSNVDRELDLLLSAQARASITEIDVALAKIDNGTYGLCEQCGAVIPEARLEALPHASLCVSCKNGGLSSRR